MLTESLTRDHRRDFYTDRLLQMCTIHEVTEELARDAARLRTQTGRAGTVSATDAIVAALAAGAEEALVLTSNPEDIRALTRTTPTRVTVAQV